MRPINEIVEELKQALVRETRSGELVEPKPRRAVSIKVQNVQHGDLIYNEARSEWNEVVEYSNMGDSVIVGTSFTRFTRGADERITVRRM